MEEITTGGYIRSQIRQSCETKQAILEDGELLSLIEAVALKCLDVYRGGRKLLLAGNGGSAADAQHIAAELVGRFYFDRPGLPCIALSTNTSCLTAIGNDYGMAQLFARQVQANGNGGDLFIGLSTSGNSENVVEALKVCKEMDIETVGLTGAAGGKMEECCTYCIKVPSDDTPRIQEAHILIGHVICSIIEEGLFGKRGLSETDAETR